MTRLEMATTLWKKRQREVQKSRAAISPAGNVSYSFLLGRTTLCQSLPHSLAITTIEG
jgi:hypothetical protein